MSPSRLFASIRRKLATGDESIGTERRELETIMSAISDAVIAVDREGTVRFYNSSFLVLLGSRMPRKDTRLGELFRNPEILEAFEKGLHSGTIRSVSAVLLDTDAGERYFSLSVSPLKEPDGTVYGAAGVFHDVTELKQAEQMRIDFVANVSHELRTPLTSIQGYAQTVAEDAEAGRPVSVELLKPILRNTERLKSLMDDLLDLSAIESNEVFQRTSLSPADVSDRVLSQMRASFEAKGQKVHVEIALDSVWAEPRRIEQVLGNLLENANKYTPPGGEITIQWERADNGDATLKVRDTGPGIPKEHQSRLFERFYRVDKSRSRAMGGTGLGLAIVKHIVQRHGGSVGLKSNPGEGSIFICRFPPRSSPPFG